MSKKELKEMLKVDKIQSAKVRGNVFFGCGDCRYQWNQDDYPDPDNKFHEGVSCPSCESKNIMAV